MVSICMFKNKIKMECKLLDAAKVRLVLFALLSMLSSLNR